MKKVVLIINIGSPDKMNIPSTRKYLRNFLMDKRVIDINIISRFLLVNGIIAPFRAPKTLQAYQKVLIDNQSPLLSYSLQLESKLQQALGNEYIVKLGMLYGKPYLNNVLNELKKTHLSEIIVLPLYPQYASSTTGAALEVVFNEIKKWQVIPNIKTIHTIYHHSDFINLWTSQIQKYLPKDYDFILFSYHGLPVRQIYKADQQFHQSTCNLKDCCDQPNEYNQYCYRFNCIHTTKLIIEKLNLPKDKTDIAFQSRLGRATWLKPYTSDCIKTLAKKGVKKLVIASPAFVTDCLETLYEIGIEYEEMFKKHGGEKLVLIPSLNVNEKWVEFLSNIIK